MMRLITDATEAAGLKLTTSEYSKANKAWKECIDHITSKQRNKQKHRNKPTC